jgi:cytochrome c oxidase cbb3-type subunit 3
MLSRVIIGVLLVISAALALSLFRIERSYRPAPGPAPTDNGRLSNLSAGGQPSAVPFFAPEGYEETAAAISDGASVYQTFNCTGCHQHGGGGIGPALMDASWIYGSTPLDIYRSIAEGRPNGMPAFGNKIPETQLRHLVAYVRGLGALVPSVLLPARDDHLQSTPSMDLQEMTEPTRGTVPPASERPP